jgi:hypothetical protein
MPVWRDIGFNEDSWADSGSNSQAGKNVLSIVVDLDLEHYFGADAGLMAAVSETAMISNDGGTQTLKQIDRMGRVEATVFIIRNNETKDLWNAEDTFNINPDHLNRYQQEVEAGLTRLDRFELSLEGINVRDWATPHPWTDLIVDDFLIVNFASAGGDYGVPPSTETINYLQIEANLFQGKAQTSIGGRVINENVITRMLTFLINGLDRPNPSRGVGVQTPDRPGGDAFPFVAAPFEP